MGCRDGKRANPTHFGMARLGHGPIWVRPFGSDKEQNFEKYHRYFGYRWRWRSTRYPSPIVDLINFQAIKIR